MDFTTINTDRIPAALKALDQWVLWTLAERDGKPTKIPLQKDGAAAKSTERSTWTDFATAWDAFQTGQFTGIGFCFSAKDDLCGIDLDGCRNPETGKVEEWAREIIIHFASYSEVSPSKTGIKIFCLGKNPFGIGEKKTPIPGAPAVGGKQAAIEVYDQGRYFAVTGWKVAGPCDPQPAQESLDWLKAKYRPDAPASPTLDFRSDDAVLDRARKYVAKMPPAMSGSGGHNQTFSVACRLVLGFELGEADALSVMREYNARCQPPWTEKELMHKIKSAAKQPGERGYLRNVKPERWTDITIPNYKSPPPPPPEESGLRVTTLADAAQAYLETLRNGGTNLIGLGIDELDYAIGGGVEKGELVIFGARPSHGKSAVALQCLHYWTAQKRRCAILSQEMSALALGKRTMQFLSDIPQEHWGHLMDALEKQIADYKAGHSPCAVLEGCGDIEVACREIERVVVEDGVECVVVDYAQLMKSAGRSRYEIVSNTSIAMRKLASRLKIVLVLLAQIGRDVEQRDTFVPVMSDLKESGQLEQDADVIIFQVWPHKIDQNEPVEKYQFFVAKNRNRAINQGLVLCRFFPDRQMVLESKPERKPEPKQVGDDDEWSPPVPDHWR